MWKFVAIIYFLFIAILHLIPGNSIPKISFSDFFQLDKLIHLILFAGSFLVLIKAFQQYSFKNKRLYFMLTCFSYAVSLEFFQSLYATNRSGDILDVLADGLGILVGLYLSTKIAFVRV